MFNPRKNKCLVHQTLKLIIRLLDQGCIFKENKKKLVYFVNYFINTKYILVKVRWRGNQIISCHTSSDRRHISFLGLTLIIIFNLFLNNPYVLFSRGLSLLKRGGLFFRSKIPLTARYPFQSEFHNFVPQRQMIWTHLHAYVISGLVEGGGSQAR